LTFLAYLDVSKTKGAYVYIMRLNKQMLGVIIGMGVMILPQAGYTVTLNQYERCSKDILLAYFPEVFVRETLKNYNVPKDQWDAITSELTAKDRDIIKQVEIKAEKLNPNPLKDPQQRQAAVKIFRDTLLENFSATLKAHGISDDKQIQAMLDDIQQQKAKRFAFCMESQGTSKAVPPEELKKSEHDDSADSHDEDDFEDEDDFDDDDEDDEDDE